MRPSRPSLTALTALLLAGCAGAPGPFAGGPATQLDRLAEELVALPCGYGFAAATDDGEVLLQLHTTTAPELVGTVDVVPSAPDVEGWSGSVLLGRDLASNWCDDVVEPDEPEPAVEARLPLSGELTWTTDGVECSGTATATLRGAAVELDGTVVQLPELALVNDAFGCFAG